MSATAPTTHNTPYHTTANHTDTPFQKKSVSKKGVTREKREPVFLITVGHLGFYPVIFIQTYEAVFHKPCFQWTTMNGVFLVPAKLILSGSTGPFN